MNGQGDRSVERLLVTPVLHLADDADLSILHGGGVQCDATASAVGAIVIEDGHLRADAGELAHTCEDGAGAVVDKPRHSQSLRVEAGDVALQGPLLPLRHGCLFWERHGRLSWGNMSNTESVWVLLL